MRILFQLPGTRGTKVRWDRVEEWVILMWENRNQLTNLQLAKG